MADEKPNPPPPVPEPTPVSQPMWDAAKEGKLALQCDPASGKAQFWPRPVNLQTGKSDYEWREVSGKGTLYAWTKVHVPAAGFADRAPYILGSVDLAEGGRIVGQLVNVEEEALSPGMAVRVCWENRSDEIKVYQFEPDS
ncbi:MAG: DNA-binding protein [Rhodospirillaceae bacterium]|nr:DNA-binding protein [Rhodospirillaceae bacterium]|tara:strand:- start:11488 stop:11907 length:420 start_codon:yes stop_codon:yes gene_type:complete